MIRKLLPRDISSLLLPRRILLKTWKTWKGKCRNAEMQKCKNSEIQKYEVEIEKWKVEIEKLNTVFSLFSTFHFSISIFYFSISAFMPFCIFHSQFRVPFSVYKKKNFFSAVKQRRLNIVQILIEYGADVNLQVQYM